jgi:hypothetical protein
VREFTNTDQSNGGTKATAGGAEHWDLHIPDLLAVPAQALPSGPVKKSDPFTETHGNVYRA